MDKDEQIIALREALANLMPWMPEGDSRTIPEEWVRAAKALATTEPEAEGSECHEGCEDPQCPYTHPQHQGESR